MNRSPVLYYVFWVSTFYYVKYDSSVTSYAKDFASGKACNIPAVLNSNLRILMDWVISLPESPQE